MLAELFRRARSIRRFHQDRPVVQETLLALVDLASLSPSSANRQSLRFLLSCQPARNQMIFKHLAWAGYLPDWPGPAAGERPAAYILLLHDRDLGPAKEVDAGLALQSMVLGATHKGLGTCILGSIQRPQLQTALSLPERYQILYVLALGEAAEAVAIEPIPADGNIRYWRDENDLFHVPKRSLSDLIVDSGNIT